MRVIIAGGSGLIGRELVSTLSAEGHEIIILSRSPERVKDLPEGARAEEWDGKTVGPWGKLVDGADAVINLAGSNIGEGRWTPERKRRIITSRIDTTQAIVEAISQAEKKPEVMVQASGVSYYGGVRGDDVMVETSSPGDDYLADVSKKWEAAAAPAAEMVRLVIVRTGIVLTTKDGALDRLVAPVNFITELTLGDGVEETISPALQPLNFLTGGGVLGSGKQWMPWIHLEDEVNAILYLMKNKSSSGVYNLAAPDIVQNKEFVRTLSKVLGRPSLIPIPGFAIKLLVGEMATLVLDGTRISSEKLVNDGFEFEYPKLTRALKDVIYSEK